VARLDDLLQNYERQVTMPWEPRLAGPQRVWFVVHDQADERRVRARVADFELRTKQAGHGCPRCKKAMTATMLSRIRGATRLAGNYGYACFGCALYILLADLLPHWEDVVGGDDE
jgi:hypothetical protein